ncbi:MAG: sigma-54-dependent transcriptional regulator [Myxococcota bacterium]
MHDDQVSNESANILIVEDDSGLRNLLVEELEEANHRVHAVESAEAAVDHIRVRPPAVVVSDLRLPGWSGMELLEHVESLDRAIRPAFVLITAFGSIPEAVKALKLGANDFLTKPLDLDHLRLRLRRILNVEAMRRRLDVWETLEREERYGELIGRSTALKQLALRIQKIGRADGPVLIEGESGTGKELAARAIHLQSHTDTDDFIPVNCAGIPNNLVESELFGHASGSFTGAEDQREGLFERAHGGTLLLDEIGELPLDIQVKLLRVLEERRVRRVGESDAFDVDVRVIAATNRDLEAEVEQGRFREDLFYRLSTFRARIAPLRERREDIEPLSLHFLNRVRQSSPDIRARGFDESAIDLFDRYPFPGNVRELKNAVERAAAFCESESIGVEHLPERMREYASMNLLEDGDQELVDHLFPDRELPTIDELKKRYATWVVQRQDGNKRQAANLLGIGRKTLYRYLDSQDD